MSTYQHTRTAGDTSSALPTYRRDAPGGREDFSFLQRSLSATHGHAPSYPNRSPDGYLAPSSSGGGDNRASDQARQEWMISQQEPLIPSPDHSAGSRQPSPIHSMRVPTENELSLRPLVKAHGQRTWSNSLFDCFGDCGACLLGFFCPCMAYSKNKTRLESLQQTGQPHPTGGNSCTSDCAVHGFLTLMLGCGWIVQRPNRTAIRQRYAIESSAVTDCLASFCCSACALTQEARELRIEERTTLNPDRRAFEDSLIDPDAPVTGGDVLDYFCRTFFSW